MKCEAGRLTGLVIDPSSVLIATPIEVPDAEAFRRLLASEIGVAVSDTGLHESYGVTVREAGERRHKAARRHVDLDVAGDRALRCRAVGNRLDGPIRVRQGLRASGHARYG